MADKMSATQIRPTGIPELDQVLRGGLPWNAAVLLAGPPGAGKTILGLQWLFAGFRDHQEPGVYFTLTETTTKLLRNLRRFDFYDPEYISSVDVRGGAFDDHIFRRPGVHLIDLRIVLKDFGLGKKDLTRADITKVCDIITEVVEKSGAKRIVIDSVTALTYRLKTEDLIRTMIFELGSYLGAMEANALMIGEGEPRDANSYGIEGFISDGVIRMSYGRVGRELVRTIEVVKMRGVDFDTHATAFRIGKEGLLMYPRRHRPFAYPVSDRRLVTGVGGFDDMTGGGYLEGSTVAVMGPSGVGKSIMSLHFLHAGLLQGEPCILVSFEESHDQIIQNASAFGWDLGRFEKEGLLKFIISDPEDRYLDEHIKNIVETVKAMGAKRLVIDSLSALGNDFGIDGVRDFASRITIYAKNLRTTMMFTLATEGLTGAVALSESHISSSIDAIIVFRYVEIQSELRRAVLVLKMRGTAHDRKLREVVISSDGMSISTDFRGYEALLSGSTRKIDESVEDQLRVLFLEVLGPMGEKIYLDERKKGLNQERLRALIEQLGSQGILSVRRKQDFLARTGSIFGALTE